MGTLRERFIEDLTLCGWSEQTIDCYVCHIQKLSSFYHKSPDLINEEELRKYLHYMKDVKAYVGNNPVNWIDPLGLEFWDSVNYFLKSIPDTLFYILPSLAGPDAMAVSFRQARIDFEDG